MERDELMKKIKEEILKQKEETEIILKQIIEEIEKLKTSDEFESSDISEQFEEKQDLHVKKEILMKKLENIDNALKRIEEGTYGICIKCKKPIEENRLKIDPLTELCRECAQV